MWIISQPKIMNFKSLFFHMVILAHMIETSSVYFV